MTVQSAITFEDAAGTAAALGRLPSVERAERGRVVDAAKTWLGTPYHPHASIKGTGVDCATLLTAAFAEAGLIEKVALPWYSPNFHLHSDEEKYSNFIGQFGGEVSRTPLPGDVLVFRFHRTFSHGAIVVAWPSIIHSMVRIGCVADDALKNQVLTTVSERVPTQGEPRPMKVFSYWAKSHADAPRS